MSPLHIEAVPPIAPDTPPWRRLIELCSSAYDEDFDPIMRQMHPAGHVLGFCDGELVAHACWLVRMLQVGGGRLLRTAYVEAVATLASHRRRGFACAVLRQLTATVADYELAALSPSDSRFYERLGWQLWRGSLAIRTDGGLMPTPNEEVMILALPRTPPLDLDASLSAEWRPGELW